MIIKFSIKSDNIAQLASKIAALNPDITEIQFKSIEPTEHNIRQLKLALATLPPQIKSVSFAGCALGYFKINYLLEMIKSISPSVTKVDLSNNYLNRLQADHFIQLIENLPIHLTELNLELNHFTIAFPLIALSKLPHSLKSLQLDDGSIGPGINMRHYSLEDVVNTFSQLPALTSLSLKNNQLLWFLTTEELKKIFKPLPLLTLLNLKDTISGSELSVEEYKKHCEEFNNRMTISNEKLQALLTSLPMLQKLIVNDLTVEKRLEEKLSEAKNCQLIDFLLSKNVKEVILPDLSRLVTHYYTDLPETFWRKRNLEQLQFASSTDENKESQTEICSSTKVPRLGQK